MTEKKPKKEKPKYIFLRCSDALWLRIANEAIRRRIHRSKMLIEIIEKALDGEVSIK